LSVDEGEGREEEEGEVEEHARWRRMGLVVGKEGGWKKGWVGVVSNLRRWGKEEGRGKRKKGGLKEGR